MEHLYYKLKACILSKIKKKSSVLFYWTFKCVYLVLIMIKQLIIHFQLNINDKSENWDDITLRYEESYTKRNLKLN